MRIVFDTNALLLPFTDGTKLDDELIRLVGAYQPILVSTVAAELQHLSEGDGKAARAAKGAQRLVQDWSTVDVALPGDDGILQALRDADAVVSNDRRLLGEAKKIGVKTIRSRGAGRLHLG